MLRCGPGQYSVARWEALVSAFLGRGPRAWGRKCRFSNFPIIRGSKDHSVRVMI